LGEGLSVFQETEKSKPGHVKYSDRSGGGRKRGRGEFNIYLSGWESAKGLILLSLCLGEKGGNGGFHFCRPKTKKVKIRTGWG